MLRAGIDDWGGVSPVTADHVNPERPWPAIDELAARSAAAGFTLRERLTVYPRTCWPARRGSTPGCTRTSPRSPTRRPVLPTRTPTVGRAAVAGAGRRIRLHRADRPAHGDRHRGPHRRPARRLRVGLRRLGRAARGAGRDPAGGAGAAGLRRPRRAARWPRPTRRRCSTRRTTPPRWRCSPPTGRPWRS